MFLFVLRSSVNKAEKFLKLHGPLSILVDSSVQGHAITHQTGWVSTGIKTWGNDTFDAGHLARIPAFVPDDSRQFREICYLPGIAYLARKGLLKFFTSGELLAEQFRQPAGRYSGYGYYDLDLFRGIDFSRVGRIHIDTHDAKNVQLRRIANTDDELTLSLINILGHNNNLDANHIATACNYKLFCFLHMDFKLDNIIINNSRKEVIKNLRTKVWTPSMLGKHLGIIPLNPNISIYEGASFPVRPDLSM